MLHGSLFFAARSISRAGLYHTCCCRVFIRLKRQPRSVASPATAGVRGWHAPGVLCHVYGAWGYNPDLPGQGHYYGLNHLHFITASTYRRARLFDSDRFRRQFVATVAGRRGSKQHAEHEGTEGCQQPHRDASSQFRSHTRSRQGTQGPYAKQSRARDIHGIKLGLRQDLLRCRRRLS